MPADVLEATRRRQRQLAARHERPGADRWLRLAPLVIVCAAVGWNLWNLHAETAAVSYLDDSSVHEQMVRFATTLLRHGAMPMTSWFPYMGLGSPQFLHYQSTPAILSGALGLMIGPDPAFRWTLYLLLSAWPISVYLCVRLFGFDRWAAAVAAAMAPFLSSATSVGYEQGAYLWVGYGVWAQLWASLTLPLAWGTSWRAIRDGRGYTVAVVLAALTTELHFETGYLALIPLLLWPFVAPGPVASRARRGAILIGGALLMTAWVTLPLLHYRNWAATNELLRHTPLVNGYGAGKVLGWLASGRLLDSGRLPVVTVFAAVGLVLVVRRSRWSSDARALLVALVACLLLSFGRTTFGSLVDVIPGSTDIFFRRFMSGVQLAALLLAGGGAVWISHAAVRGLGRLLRSGQEIGQPRAERALLTLAGLAALFVVLTPAWLQARTLDRRNARAISFQRRADRTAGAAVDRLIAIIHRDGGGRTYAGSAQNWGTGFTVGAVPVFKYLESRDVDEVGYTLRTASLMTDPEAFFDDRELGDYSLLGIRWLIFPVGRPPPVPAHLVMQSGRYRLWITMSTGYVHVGSVVGILAADRTNVGLRSVPLLRSNLAGHGHYLAVAFGGQPAGTAQTGYGGFVGRVLSERDSLTRGETTATVALSRPGVAVFSASFDPGWHVTIDDRTARTMMIAPALVGTAVPAGVHNLGFRYVGYSGYAWLLLLAGLTVIALLVLDIRLRRPVVASPRFEGPIEGSSVRRKDFTAGVVHTEIANGGHSAARLGGDGDDGAGA
jgi:hypothetical protein